MIGGSNKQEVRMVQHAEQLKVNVRPLGHRVLAQRLESEESLKGGIILPDSAKKKQEMARVLAVGPGKTEADGRVVAVPVAVGDVILLDKYSGQEVSIDGEEFLIVRGDDIVAVIV